MLFLVVCCYLRNHKLKQFLSISTSNENDFFFLPLSVHFLMIHSTHFTFYRFHSWILSMVIIIVNIRARAQFPNTLYHLQRYDIFFSFILENISNLHISIIIRFSTCQVFLKIFLFHIYTSLVPTKLFW